MTALRARPAIRAHTRTADPLNVATPGPALTSQLTPAAALFVRSHFPTPELDPDTWRLHFGGAVDRPFSVSLDDLGGLPRREVQIVLECAGNRRSRMRPLPPGLAWGDGAVGCLRFAGASVRDVLSRAGLKSGTREILFVGADHGHVHGGFAAFERALPVAKALHPDTLLATHINGEPLTPEHGAPVRLVVPGWYGVASVKWLVEIRALKQPFAGAFQTESYVYRNSHGDTIDGPVGPIRVSSTITRPAPHSVLIAGREVCVSGNAWSDGSAIAKVEVSADRGASWRPARLSNPAGQYAWTMWSLAWGPPTRGTHRLLARAIDADGRRQPVDSPWNSLGYGNNAVASVDVLVRAAPRDRQ
jgi:DMSO/TMAO reductase YedYZ molybdopterin-dependent catalytic subunit